MKNFLLLLLVILPFLLASQTAQAEDRSLMHKGVERNYIIDKPTSAKDGAKLPVVIVLHGGGGTAESARRMTHFSDKIMPRGVIIVYPEGMGRFERIKKLKTWNAGHCCAYAMENKIDDVGFIGALIDSLIANDGADPKRIYVTGLSNGGMMTQRLGIQLSDKIAAIAPVISGLFGDEPQPSSPVSAMIINGKLDQSVPLDGGENHGRFADTWDGTPLKPAAYQGAFWAVANNCKPAPQVETFANGGVTVARYTCPVGHEAMRYIVNDGGHSWPGGDKGSLRGDEPSMSMDATEEIWAFFSRQKK